MSSPYEKNRVGADSGFTLFPKAGREWEQGKELIEIVRPLPFQKFIRMACKHLGVDPREVPAHITGDRIVSYLGWQMVRSDDPTIARPDKSKMHEFIEPMGFGGYFRGKKQPVYSEIGYARRADKRFKERLNHDSVQSSDAVGILGRGEMQTDNFSFLFGILEAADQEVGQMVKELNAQMNPNEQAYQQETKTVAEQLAPEMRWKMDDKGVIWEAYPLPRHGFRTTVDSPRLVTLDEIRRYRYTPEGEEDPMGMIGGSIYPAKPHLPETPHTNEMAYRFMRDAGMVGNPYLRFLIEQVSGHPETKVDRDALGPELAKLFRTVGSARQ